jgi:hypothetical protein
MTDFASRPHAFVPVIVGLAEPPSMADDRVVLAKGRRRWEENVGRYSPCSLCPQEVGRDRHDPDILRPTMCPLALVWADSER